MGHILPIALNSFGEPIAILAGLFYLVVSAAGWRRVERVKGDLCSFNLAVFLSYLCRSIS